MASNETDPRAIEATQAPREFPSQGVFIGGLAIGLLAFLAIGTLLGLFLVIQPG